MRHIWAAWRWGVPGRHKGGKALIVVAAQEDGAGIGRIRMRQIPDASAESLFALLRENIQPGTVIRTDGWRATAAHPPRVLFMR
jgi:hypothetical protein